jgi:RNA polymerase sigma-70 factor, ECF subfamily
MVLLERDMTTTLPLSDLVSPAHEAMVRAYLGAITGDPGAVDDLSQEVFLRAIRRIELLPLYATPGHMLRGIARRVAQEFFRVRRRRHRRYVDATLDRLAGDDQSVAEMMQHRESLALLRDAVNELPIVARRLLEMRYHDGLTAEEAGRELGIQPGAVRVTLLRLRERLRRRIDAALGEPVV